ncbi:MAG TPA: peptide deformylase [Chloroflexia bacterium]|nr:peptide deformylase [Chloroflexia bacterium]
MSLLTILTDDNPRVRLKSQKVTKFDKNLRKLSEDMLETMREADGVGLAAPQVGILQRLVVIEFPADYEYEGSPARHLVIANPELIKKGGGEESGIEGCLSVPGWYGEVDRFLKVTVRGQDINGKPIRFEAEGEYARCLQHEVDHLDGILYTDRIKDPRLLRRVEDDDEEEEDASQQAALQNLLKSK